MDSPIPSLAKAARILMFVAAGIYAIGAASGLYLGGVNGVSAGLVFVVTWPGIVYLALALLIGKGGRVLFWAIVVFQALLVLMALNNFLSAQISGLFQMIVPALVLSCVLAKQSRDFFAGRDRSYA